MANELRMNHPGLSGKSKILFADLQGTHVSKMGYEFVFDSERWEIGGSERLYFNKFPDVDIEFMLGIKAILAKYAEEYSARFTASMLAQTLRYLKLTGERSLTLKGVVKFKSLHTKDDEYQFGSVKAFWLAWHDAGYPGIDKMSVEYVEELVLRGIEKGKAVKVRCPYTGPLTELEQGAVLDWASNAFIQKEIDLRDYTLFLTIVMTGRRLVQARYLRACDLTVLESSDGNNYVLSIPRVKQKGQEFREVFSSLPIVEDLFLLLNNLVNESQMHIEDRLGLNLPNKIAKQMPIFIEWNRINKVKSVNDLENLLECKPDYLHMNSDGGMAAIRTISIKNRAISERTGDFIYLTSRRFRYTKATNLARRGISGVALAYALDHSDTQHISVYTDNTSKNAEIISEIMSESLAPIAQAFAGTLIDSERDAIRVNDPHSRVKNNESHSVGNCGAYAFCASGYRSCYTCVKFQPWRDAPHNEVLEEIVAERKRQEAIGVSLSVIQATDRLLLAVIQVIQMCKKANNESEVFEEEITNV